MITISRPGGSLMEIVPLEDKLLIEARISRRDIAFIRPRLPATVKITAYDPSIYGTVDRISPDTLQDEVNREQVLAGLSLERKHKIIERELRMGVVDKMIIDHEIGRAACRERVCEYG